MSRYLMLALAGTVGTCFRYYVSNWVQSRSGSSFPWGTLSVNALGCFLFGFVWSVAEERMLIRLETRIILLSGFIGAFTTFSSFSFETVQLLRDGQSGQALLNIILQLVFGLTAVFAGLIAGRQI